MAVYRFICPPGIGDFSWLWTKFSTTQDQYHIEYAVHGPDRLGPFLALLPKSKIAGFKANVTHTVSFSLRTLEMRLVPTDIQRLRSYSQFKIHPDHIFYVEPNTHLENGGRIEKWMPELETNFHYKIEGTLDNPQKENKFIVHLSSKHMQEVWKCYSKEKVIEIIDMVQRKTSWLPVFIGADYDDFAQEVFETYSQNHGAYNLTGKTPDLLGALHAMQRSKMFLGLVSSGMTMLANVLNIPTAAWWPRPKLPQSWADESIPYKWFLWQDYKKDMAELEGWVTKL
jgi:hypothetical protein